MRMCGGTDDELSKNTTIAAATVSDHAVIDSASQCTLIHLRQAGCTHSPDYDLSRARCLHRSCPALSDLSGRDTEIAVELRSSCVYDMKFTERNRLADRLRTGFAQTAGWLVLAIVSSGLTGRTQE